ncbi:chromosome segregation protein [Mycoplasmoides fastidiosum]|uniref:Chromosome partition protein Smc n=1 Tax=Mycoplasmoides fastidiosum TaxID=92758 RepID=A0ABU0LZG2_9BACT|nr:AAA family ATPase [Mycoplasmoides fastidiosum]MDQ0514064.1 chromosome segregation protein [Mycoplasmoides fastidiosum]UUD37525.1 AAA family ATPase [Mycoplasmoides fastidiosum]
MFLKRFESRGFKSFADVTVINFENNMTGVVGPNGSGKSNIVDGLKWVLGERSSKQLRGKQNTDFIFSGSDAREAANFAEVSLTFDNSAKLLRTNLEEITITRRLTRGVGKNEYFINGEPCLRNEIVEIFLDTGLSKGSLGIISQGTVSWFTETKAVDRRKIFEDAAGIGKYTLLKKETIAELDKTKLDLKDAEISLNNIDRQVKKLEKQAEKARIYLDKKEQLKKIEVTVLAQEILEETNNLKAIQADIESKESSNLQDNQEIDNLKQKLQLLKDKFTEIDQGLHANNQIIHDLISECNQLEIQKNKYETELEQQLTAGNIEEKIGALKQIIDNKTLEIKELSFSKEKLEQEHTTFQEIQTQLSREHELLMREINQVSNRLEQKRQEQINLQNQLADRYRYEYGVKAVLKAKNSLTGIYDMLSNLIRVEPEHEVAIGLALGKALKNIVVDNSEDARKAIEFLKRNQAGAATFLPINDLKIRYMPDDHYEILNQLDNFIGLGNELVHVEEKFQPVIDALLARIIISYDINSAIHHSKFTNKNYRVITLDGQQISTLGAISGGYNRKRTNTEFNIEEKIQNLDTEIQEQQAISQKIREQSEKNQLNFRDNTEKVASRHDQLVLIKSQIETLTNQLKEYEWNYNHLAEQAKDPEGISHKKNIDNLLIELVEKKQKLEQQKMIVQSDTKIKNNLHMDIENYEFQLENLNSSHKKIHDQISDLKIRAERIKSLLNSHTDRLMDGYQFTPEYAIENFSEPLDIKYEEARMLIRRLSEEIRSMGDVNFEAANDLKNLEEDYKNKQEQYQIISQAVADLEKVLADLNQKAIESFDQIIKQTNEKLPEIFKYLFGGGTCEIIYDDPENILECGIEIHAYLPGKTITNLMLFSGGEKTLIALSVLFAVLQVSSLPLVILDEAESALDPANVERFGNIIKNNSERTQFIIITHRNGTMECCESLFGVTMMIKGISKIIPVELKKALEIVESDQDK